METKTPFRIKLLTFHWESINKVMEAMAIQECLRKLKSEFDCSDDFLRDIIINSNVDYQTAYDMCKELGVAQKSSSTNIKKKKSDEFSVEPAEDTIGEPFLEYYLGLSSNAVLTFWNYMIYFPILIYLYWQENTGIIITICRRQLIKSFGVKQSRSEMLLQLSWNT